MGMNNKKKPMIVLFIKDTTKTCVQKCLTKECKMIKSCLMDMECQFVR